MRSRRRFCRTPVPSMILANVQRLHNKIDELLGRIETQKDYKNCNVFCFTETWLTPPYHDSLAQPPGFTLFRQDRDNEVTGKSKGGGVCFLVNNQWCADVKIISKGCTINLEY